MKGSHFVDEELTLPSDVSDDELDEKIGTSGKYPRPNSESMVNLDNSGVELEVESTRAFVIMYVNIATE